MAEVIKNVVIPTEDLPPLQPQQTNYVIRYRVVSEDKNRSSAWSPIITIQDTQES
jgi:hypothetical protein